jgi:hypothetical protein
MRRSDVLLLILSERTSASPGLLSWEIELAANECKLPIICSYTGCPDVETVNAAWWPPALRHVISRGARTEHVRFHPRALAQVFRSFAVAA